MKEAANKPRDFVLLDWKRDRPEAVFHSFITIERSTDLAVKPYGTMAYGDFQTILFSA
jgi:hypothetical protein